MLSKSFVQKGVRNVKVIEHSQVVVEDKWKPVFDFFRSKEKVIGDTLSNSLNAGGGGPSCSYAACGDGSCTGPRD